MELKKFSIAMKVLYFFLIIIVILEGSRNAWIYNGAILLALIATYYLGRFDEDFYKADFFFTLLFTVAFVLAYFGHGLVTSVLGIDKPFHFFAGMATGLFSYIGLRKYIKNELVLYFCVICLTIAFSVGWETFEWLMVIIEDGFFSTKLNQALYIDTMLDNIVVGAGSLLTCLILRITNASFLNKP